MAHLFRSSAYALAARFTQPPSVIPTQAGVILGASGGESSAVVRNFNYKIDKRAISFSEANANVTGSVSAEGARHALATVTIKRVNVLGTVKADKIVANVRSEHGVPRREGMVGEGAVTFEGSVFENLEIGGKPVKLKLNSEIFSTHPTYEDFAGIQQPRGKSYRWSAGGGDAVIVTSLVEQLEVPGFKVEGHIVFIPDFGKIHVAEVIVERGERRLHMLRFELGSPIVGAAVLGGVDGNGADIPL
jgi:hypothetical protein